jgi:hypothetical protein
VRQSLAQDSGQRNLFQYVRDYAHSVLLWPNDPKLSHADEREVDGTGGVQ